MELLYGVWSIERSLELRGKMLILCHTLTRLYRPCPVLQTSLNTDMVSGYWQVEIDDSAREKLAFSGF